MVGNQYRLTSVLAGFVFSRSVARALASGALPFLAKTNAASNLTFLLGAEPTVETTLCFLWDVPTSVSRRRAASSHRAAVSVDWSREAAATARLVSCRASRRWP